MLFRSTEPLADSLVLVCHGGQTGIHAVPARIPFWPTWLSVIKGFRPEFALFSSAILDFCRKSLTQNFTPGQATQLENVDCFTANSQGYFGPGAYLVGETIPAGTYQLFQMSPSAQTYAGFYCIYHNIDSGLLDIVKNGYFDFYGSKSITLKEGQILELNYGYMKAVS